MPDPLDLPVCASCGAPVGSRHTCPRCKRLVADRASLPTRREWEQLHSGAAPGTYDPFVADDELAPEPRPRFAPWDDQRYAGRPLASWGRRVGAFLIDLTFASAVFFTVTVVATIAGASTETATVLAWVGFGVAWVANTIGLAGTEGGQTLGKMLLGLRLVEERGGPADLTTAAMRELTRVAWVFPLFFVVDSLAALGDRRQTLRDRQVRTRVIEDRG